MIFFYLQSDKELGASSGLNAPYMKTTVLTAAIPGFI